MISRGRKWRRLVRKFGSWIFFTKVPHGSSHNEWSSESLYPCRISESCKNQKKEIKRSIKSDVRRFWDRLWIQSIAFIETKGTIKRINLVVSFLRVGTERHCLEIPNNVSRDWHMNKHFGKKTKFKYTFGSFSISRHTRTTGVHRRILLCDSK